MGPTKLFKMGRMKLFEMGPMNWYQWYPRLDIVCSHVLPPYSTCHYLHLKWYSFTGLRVATAPCGLADTKSHEEKRWRDDSTLRQTFTTGKIYFLRFRKIKESGFILIIMIQIWPICVAYRSSYRWEFFLRGNFFQLFEKGPLLIVCRVYGHFPYHPDTFSWLSRHFLDHPDTFSRLS